MGSFPTLDVLIALSMPQNAKCEHCLTLNDNKNCKDVKKSAKSEEMLLFLNDLIQV